MRRESTTVNDRPLPQTDIEDDMRRVNNELERVTQALAGKVRAEARSTHAYKVAYAQAFLRARADGAPMDECAQRATADCDQLLLTRLGAEAEADALKEAGRNARAMGENLRSINANHRALVSGS